MNRIANIQKQIAILEGALSQLKVELASLEQESTQRSTTPIRQKQAAPTPDELKNFYDEIYAKFVRGNSRDAEEQLRSKNVSYLGAFCKVNDLPIDTKKVSKQETISSIIQWLAQRKAITQKSR